MIRNGIRIKTENAIPWRSERVRRRLKMYFQKTRNSSLLWCLHGASSWVS